MAARGQLILLEALDGSSPRLAERMLAFGAEGFITRGFDEAEEILRERKVLINGILVPTDQSTQDLKRDMKELRRVGPASGLTGVSVGRRPSADERKKLRAAGLSIALWEPFDDGTLRFQLNRAISGDRDEHARSDPRVPTYLLARIYVGGRTKDAVVYSLSSGGCFLETPRASMDGARLEVELRLPTGPIRVNAAVVFANVPGNLQKANLPLGMGVQFARIDSDDQHALNEFITQRLGELNV